MLRRPWLLLAAVAATGCASAHLSWAGAPVAEDPEPSGPAYLRDYKEEFYKSLGDEFAGFLRRKEFIDATSRTRIVYLGDHHTDRDLHGQHLALLEQMHAAGVPVVLGLEAIGEEDDLDLREFLARRCSLAELRTRVVRRWPESWLENAEVDAPFYRQLLALARLKRWPVFALEPAPRLPLSLRDAAIAENIRRIADNHPLRVIVVIVGHAHLLGTGRLVERVDLPFVATGARMSVSLLRQWAHLEPPNHAAFTVTESGVAFFLDGPTPPR